MSTVKTVTVEAPADADFDQQYNHLYRIPKGTKVIAGQTVALCGKVAQDNNSETWTPNKAVAKPLCPICESLAKAGH